MEALWQGAISISREPITPIDGVSNVMMFDAKNSVIRLASKIARSLAVRLAILTSIRRHRQ